MLVIISGIVNKKKIIHEWARISPAPASGRNQGLEPRITRRGERPQRNSQFITADDADGRG